MKYTLTRIPHLLVLLALVAIGTLFFSGRTVNTDTSLFATTEEATSTIPALTEEPPLEATTTPPTTVPEEFVATTTPATTPETLVVPSTPSVSVPLSTAPPIDSTLLNPEYCHSPSSFALYANPGECMRALLSR